MRWLFVENCAIGHHNGPEYLVGQPRLVRQRGQRLSGGNLLQDFSGQIYFPKRVILWYASEYKAILPNVRYATYPKFEEIYTNPLIRDTPKSGFEKP